MPKVELTSVLDLSMNTPPPPDGVDFDDLLKQGLSQVLMRADNELLKTYHLGGGSPSDRRAGRDGSSRCSAPSKRGTSWSVQRRQIASTRRRACLTARADLERARATGRNTPLRSSAFRLCTQAFTIGIQLAQVPERNSS